MCLFFLFVYFFLVFYRFLVFYIYRSLLPLPQSRWWTSSLFSLTSSFRSEKTVPSSSPTEPSRWWIALYRSLSLPPDLKKEPMVDCSLSFSLTSSRSEKTLKAPLFSPIVLGVTRRRHPWIYSIVLGVTIRRHPWI